MTKILLLASGSGSNVENIVTFFRQKNISITYKIVSNKVNAGVFQRAKKLEIDSYYFSKNEINDTVFENFVSDFSPDLIVLAGFLLLFPANIIKNYPNKIINIHPALLPNYGGKGMYGMNVHKKVLENKETETGVTIHYVNEKYDDGAFILQKSTCIKHCQTAEEIAQKVHQLEYEFFPETILKLLKIKL